MDQGNYVTHLSAHQGDPRGREGGADVMHRAVQLIAAKHSVGQMSAYTILVQAAVDSHSSVRETAVRIIADAPGAA